MSMVLRYAPLSTSFPLLGLADDLGLDYGDVLQVAELVQAEPLRMGRRDLSPRREVAAHLAFARIRDRLGSWDAVRLRATVGYVLDQRFPS